MYCIYVSFYYRRVDLSIHLSIYIDLSIYLSIWLYLDAEVLVLPPPVLSSGLCFCWLPNFVDIQLNIHVLCSAPLPFRRPRLLS